MNKKTLNKSDNEPRYVISIAAKMLGVETYTLRYYEKIGIIRPQRSRGNIRLYSEQDLVLLRRVKSLIDDTGINLAGAEVIMRMMQRILEMHNELERLRQEMRKLER